MPSVRTNRQLNPRFRAHFLFHSGFRNAAASISLKQRRLVYGVCRGPACVLERLPEAVACIVSGRPVSGEQRTGEDQLSSDQQENGHSHQYRKVDAETGDEVELSEIIKGYEVGKGQYIEIDPEELEAIAIESKRTIEIDESCRRKKSTSCI